MKKSSVFLKKMGPTKSFLESANPLNVLQSTHDMSHA